MVSADNNYNSGSRGSGSSPGRGHCVVFLDYSKTRIVAVGLFSNGLDTRA